MKNSERYGFKEETDSSDIGDILFLNTRIFIDRVLKDKGLNLQLITNPILEKELTTYLLGVDMNEVDLDSETIVIDGKKISVVEGNLLIEEKKNSVGLKELTQTTYAVQSGKKGIIKSKESVSGNSIMEGTSVFEGYSEEYGYYTDNGIEMSKIYVDQYKYTNLQSNSSNQYMDFFNYTPKIPGEESKTKFVLDSEHEKLEILKLPNNYRTIEELNRDPDYVDKMSYMKIERDKGENEKRYSTKICINDENGISKLRTVPGITDYCIVTDFKTGEMIRKPKYESESVYQHLNEKERITSAIKKSVYRTREVKDFKNNITFTPLQRRTLAELIKRSNYRCSIKDILGDNDYNLVNELLNENDYKRASSTLKINDLIGITKDISDLKDTRESILNEKSGEEIGR